MKHQDLIGKVCNFLWVIFQKFLFEGLRFNSTEQYYCFRKCIFFKCFRQAQKILLTTDPAKIKELGNGKFLREIHRNKEENNSINFTSEKWAEIRIPIMWAALTLKFAIPELSRWLIETGKGFIVESNPFDSFWGII